MHGESRRNSARRRKAGNSMLISILLFVYKNLSSSSLLGMILSSIKNKFFFKTKGIESWNRLKSSVKENRSKWFMCHMDMIWINLCKSITRMVPQWKYIFGKVQKTSERTRQRFKEVHHNSYNMCYLQNFAQNRCLLESPRHKQQQKSPSCKQQ